MGSVVKTVGTVVALAIVAVSAGCSGSAEFREFDPSNFGSVTVEPGPPGTIQEALNRTAGGARGETITLADGSRYVVDAQDNPRVPIGYRLVGALDKSGDILEIKEASIGDSAYLPGKVSGVFEYSGRAVALLGRDGAVYQRVAGRSELAIDFDLQEARLEAATTGVDAEAELAGVLAFDRESGRLSADGLAIEYSDQKGDVVTTADLMGAVYGDNAAYSAVFKPEVGDIRGAGIVEGRRDD